MNRPAHLEQKVEAVSNPRRLTDPIGLDVLEEMQERFAALGRMTVCICTLDGVAITQPTWGSLFSKLIGTSAIGGRAWQEALQECTIRSDSSAPATCHEGMTLHATPIVADEQALAMLVIGTRSELPSSSKEIRRIADMYKVNPDELESAAKAFNPASGGTREDILRFAETLAHIIATIHTQASRITRQLADLRTVHELSQLLAGSLDLQEILDVTVRRVVEVMEVKACAIRLLNFENGELVIKAVHNLSDEYLNKGAVLLRDNIIDAKAFAGEAVTIEDAANDPRIRYPQNARREGIVSGLCVPVAYRGEAIGVIRVYTSRRHVFTEPEESLLRSIGSQAAAAIIHGRLRSERTQSERIERQVATAGEIQRRMLPSRAPEWTGVQLGCVYDPTLLLGGDFYDFIELPDGQLGVCIADVVGKGVPAALLMASIRSTLRAYAPTSDDITRIVRQTNRDLCRDTLVSEFATLFYCVLSHDGRRLVYCNAGHPPPILLRGDDVCLLDEGGLVIGIEPTENFEQGVIDLNVGDVVVMVTDGVTEAMSFSDEAYGDGRLLESVRQHRALSADQMAQQILWDVRRFVGLAEQSDDITVVTIKAV